MTRTVSSPATVPRMDGQAAWSMAEARNWAAPAGVRSTTRFALASAEVSSSLRYLTRRDDPPGAVSCLPSGLPPAPVAVTPAGRGTDGPAGGVTPLGVSRGGPGGGPGPRGLPGRA